MKKIVYTLLISLVMNGTFSACTSLESESYSQINTTIFPTNADDADALVIAAAYGPFRADGYSGLFCASKDGLYSTDMSTDVLDCKWGDSWWPAMLQVNYTALSDIPTQYYSTWANHIGKMTLTLNRIENVSMDEDTKARLIAETRCGRGWLAYILYDLYGGIQIPSLEVLQNPSEKVIVARSSSEETVKFIEDDLKAAIEILPSKYSYSDEKYGRFTKGLAYTVLMKLYMQEKRWDEAVECGREIMKCGYSLVPHYKDIFTLENEGNDETIYACIEKRGVNEQMWHAHVLPSDYPTENENIQKWNGYRMPWDFYHTFDANDERLEVICGEYTGVDGTLHNEETDRNDSSKSLDKGALPIKYGEDPTQTSESSEVDIPVYRYADVLTLMSEALARQANGVTQEAIDLLNEVHTRAGLTAYNPGDFSNLEAFLDTVLLERGHEFWAEGLRRTDLIRHGKFVEYAKKYKSSTTVQDYMTLMPIPQNIITESGGVVQQNPGY